MLWQLYRILAFSAALLSMSSPNSSSGSGAMLVTTPMVGLIMLCSLAISPGREMPASIMASVVSSSMSHSDSGTPICELKLRGERTMR